MSVHDRYSVDRRAAARAALRWLRNPVSIDGPTNLKRIKFAAGGPSIAAQVEQMRTHPDGSRILRDRPELRVALSDMGALSAMPAGSLGRAYHEFMSHPAAVPTYLLGSVLYRGGDFDALDWSEEMKFLTERMNYIHDLTHVISGYGTHLASEAINIAFNLGLEGRPQRPIRGLTGVFAAMLWPAVGLRRWRAEMDEAYRRGLALHQTIPFHCIYWEELLPLPLDTAREQLGLPTDPEPLDTTSWVRSPLGKRIANGYGRAGDRDAKQRQLRLVEALGGIEADPRDLAALIDIPDSVRDQLHRALADGATEADLRSIAQLQPRTTPTALSA